MKKILVTIICTILVCIKAVYAEESQTLTDKMNSIWLSPAEDVVTLEKIKSENTSKIEETIALYLIAPGYAREKIGISADDDKMKSQVNEMYAVKENETIKVHYMKNNKYARQYADNQSLKYLISDDFYWFMNGRRYNADGTMYDYKNEDFSSFGFTTISNTEVEFLQNEALLAEVFGSIDISAIESVKIVALNPVCTVLYVDCGADEYIICLHIGVTYEQTNGIYNSSKWIKNIELYKLYNAREFMQIISDEEDMMNSEKVIFKAEAISLQEAGLLNGNENGLDLLKPLTRIEAATIILRAMGESTTSATAEQTFTDVSPAHWGYSAAEKAYSLGLINGIGDGLFAPDDIVTGTQFAAMVLRAGNYTEFNWEEALDILVENKIITKEDTDTFDFFTRGDMAKIIYEGLEKGLF